jgi:hypothetical protein
MLKEPERKTSNIRRSTLSSQQNEMDYNNLYRNVNNLETLSQKAGLSRKSDFSQFS